MSKEVLHYKDAVHFQPSTKTANVRCLNGSAHLKETRDINLVTCEICKDKNANLNFWSKYNV